MSNGYYTPTEILDRNPRLRKFWNAQKIGYLFMLKLVSGKRLGAKKGCEVSESDVLKMAESIKSA